MDLTYNVSYLHSRTRGIYHRGNPSTPPWSPGPCSAHRSGWAPRSSSCPTPARSHPTSGKQCAHQRPSDPAKSGCTIENDGYYVNTQQQEAKGLKADR